MLLHGWLTLAGQAAGMDVSNKYVVFHLALVVVLLEVWYALTMLTFCWLCSYGVGSRMKLAYTRKIIDAIHDGSLLNAKYVQTPIFNLSVPTEVNGVPSEVLEPQNAVCNLSKRIKRVLVRFS